MHKKGQAAMEFLMTYGWAILAAIIAIGVLAYFGVFSPGRLVGGSAIVSPPFNIDDFRIADGAGGTDNVTLQVTQSLGESVSLSLTDTTTYTDNGFEITLADNSVCNVTGPVSPAVIVSSGTPDPWPTGEQITVLARCDPASWTKDDNARGTITIRYTKAGGLQQVSTGNFRGKAQ
jgi:hypothetical protein